MIIIVDIPGQLGNQLWSYCNMIAIARSFRQRIIVILKKEYYEMLDVTTLKKAGCAGVYIYSSHTFKSRIINKTTSFLRNANTQKLFNLLKLAPTSEHIEYISNYVFLTRSNRYLHFINSWNQRENKEYFIKNHSFIKGVIKPAKKIKLAVDSTISTIKNQYNTSITIGCHIRRGDYKDFDNGKYFFEDVVYKGYMEDLKKLFSNTLIVFYIFSNEKISLDNYAGLNIFFQKDQLPIADMWAMSKCDYIIGPPSTFSMWASFWNSTPLHIIKGREEILGLDSFKPIIAIDLFEDYTRWWNN